MGLKDFVRKGFDAIKKSVKNTAESVENYFQEQKDNQILKKAVEGKFDKLFLQGDGKSNKEVFGLFDVSNGLIFFPLTHEFTKKIAIKDLLKSDDGKYIKLTEKDESELHQINIEYKSDKYEVTCFMFKYKVIDL